MPAEHHPTDVLVRDLLGVYQRAGATLETLIAEALRRGLDPIRAGTADAERGDATLAYRQRQLQQALAIIDSLERQAGTAATVVTSRAYSATVLSVDAVLRRGGLASSALTGQFGGIHARAVQALAGQLGDSLAAAAQRTRANTVEVFRAAQALSGPLPPSGEVGGVQFLGRRFNDALREVSLQAIAEGQVTMQTRRQVTASLAQRLITEGVATATSGFVDKRGRRWPLRTYARMAVITTTREATSRATVTRLGEHDQDLVTVSSHAHKADECTPYDGNTYSISGQTDGYEQLDVAPPFHPNCAHVLTPAAVSFDVWLAELEAQCARAAGG